MKKILLVIVLLQLSVILEAKELYRAKSLYRDIYVVENNDLLCLKFSIPRREDTSQSCMDRNDPLRMVFNYTRMMMATVLINPEPRSILIVGLGGGSLPTAFNDMYPEAEITSVEIDPAVAKVARKYFDFKETEKNKVVIKDARLHIKRQALKKKMYDLIILDAFGSDYIPEHLTTVEFLQEVKQVLSPQGVLASNTFSSSKYYHHESSTYAEVFGKFFVMQTNAGSNRIILHSEDDTLLDIENIQRNVEALGKQLEKYDVDADLMYRSINTLPMWDESARPLTDQYSPANILNAKEK